MCEAAKTGFGEEISGSGEAGGSKPWTEDEDEILRVGYAGPPSGGWFGRLCHALRRGAKEISDRVAQLGIERRGFRPRPHLVRGHTVSQSRKLSLEEKGEDYPEDVDRPKSRADCQGGERPCPFVSCEHHLYLDVNPYTGNLKLNFPDLEVDEMVESCVLDVADRGGVTLEEVGAVLNLTRERVRQIEVRGLLKLRETGVE